MLLLHTVFVLAMAILSTANSVHFINQDTTHRTVFFTPQEGHTAIEPIEIPGNSAAHQKFPLGWTGNWYSVSEGSAKVPGMLGEVSFDGYNGATYFDVSAIVNPNDTDGVKEIFPASADKPVSGCQSFPCLNAYNKADDLQTDSTDSKELICLLGNVSNIRQRGMAALLAKKKKALIH